MISNWKESSIESFEQDFLKSFWDLKLTDTVIELKSPVISHCNGYGGIFIGSLVNLDTKIFESLTIDFPGLTELRKVRDMMLSAQENTENIDKAYDSVLRDVIIGRDFPLFMLTVYSQETAAHLYPLGINNSDKLFLNTIFSYENPISSLSGSNRSVIYAMSDKKRYTGFQYLCNYFGSDKPELLISYRLWDKISFNKFAKLLSNNDHGHGIKARNFMEESGSLFNNRVDYILIDENNEDTI